MRNVRRRQCECTLDIGERAGERLLRQRVHEVEVDVVEAAVLRGLDRALGLGRRVDAAESTQLVVVETLHAEVKRLTPARRYSSKRPCSTVPGFVSIVISALRAERAGADEAASRIAPIASAKKRLGVPPPKKTLAISRRPIASPKRAKSASRSRASAATYSAIGSAPFLRVRIEVAVRALLHAPREVHVERERRRDHRHVAARWGLMSSQQLRSVASARPRWLTRFLTSGSSSAAASVETAIEKVRGRSRNRRCRAVRAAMLRATRLRRSAARILGARIRTVRRLKCARHRRRRGHLRRSSRFRCRIPWVAGIARGVDSRRAAQRVDAEAGIVRQRRQSASRNRRVAPYDRILQESASGSSASAMPRSDCATSSMPVSASTSRISASLPRLPLARTMRGGITSAGSASRWTGRARQRLSTRARAARRARRGGRLAFGGALHLDETAAAVHDDIHVGVGQPNLRRSRVEHRHAFVDADRNRGHAPKTGRAAICRRASRCERVDSATKAPVIAAVRVPPSACSTSQSSVIVRSPSAARSITARNDRPIRRWISCVRPDCLPRAASRCCGCASRAAACRIPR